MESLYYIIFFILGSIMGSFFHATATRLAKEESIVLPSSHCHYCKHKLKWYELIPIISYIIQKGKCIECHKKIPISYLVIEIVTALLYSVSYHVFGLSYDLIIALAFISILIINIISDIEYMIILDEVLLFGICLIIVLNLLLYGIEVCAYHICYGLISFFIMYLIKIIGDLIFKRESMGGGDIKLMYLFGLVMGAPLAITTIFLATFIAFPIALVILIRQKDNMIPFGPFLSMAAILILISGVSINEIIGFIVK